MQEGVEHQGEMAWLIAGMLTGMLYRHGVEVMKPFEILRTPEPGFMVHFRESHAIYRVTVAGEGYAANDDAAEMIAKRI